MPLHGLGQLNVVMPFAVLPENEDVQPKLVTVRVTDAPSAAPRKRAILDREESAVNGPDPQTSPDWSAIPVQGLFPVYAKPGQGGGGNPAHAPGEVTGLGLAVVRVADMPPAFDQVPTL